MIIKKEDLEKALLDILNSAIKLKALRSFLEKRGLQIEQIDCPEYNAALKELENYQKELDKALEGAKETIISGFRDKEISLLDKIKRFNPDEVQKYYITEAYINLAYVVNRSRQIKPLYVKRKAPLPIDKRYREAVLCYLNGRFDACCVMCRAIVEMVLKELCKLKFKNADSFEKYSLSELIDTCSNFNILSSMELRLVKSIRDRGNTSIHAKTFASEQDAISSIKETQNFLKSAL